ncbi:MAG: TIGR01777 family oxidoreductase [Bacteroidota bacterium]
MPTKNPKKILITGATGLIGTRLTTLLQAEGHEVSHLGRSKSNSGVQSFIWDINHHQIDPEALQQVDSIVHLAGAGIADRPWTKARKHEILESRTKSTQLLFETLHKGHHAVKNFIGASAIGYYGFEDPEAAFVESDKPGNDFLAHVTRQWEAETDKISTLDVRVVKMRTGIVLSENGGVLKEIAKTVKWYVGALLGSGDQYISWVHIDDLCRMYIKAIEDEAMNGPYNAVTPYPVTNREMTETIADVLERPIILPPVPEFVLKLLLGEMANLVLRGSRVSADRIVASGYQFQYTDLETAIRQLLKK